MWSHTLEHRQPMMGHTPEEKWLPPTSIHKLSSALQVRVKPHKPFLSGRPTGLILCKYCLDSYNYCEFMNSIISQSFPGDIIAHFSFPTSGSCMYLKSLDKVTLINAPKKIFHNNISIFKDSPSKYIMF